MAPRKHHFSYRGFWTLLRTVMGPELRRFVAWTFVIALVYFHNLVPAFLVGKIVDFLTGLPPGGSISPLYWYCGALSGLMILAAMIRLQAKSTLGEMTITAASQVRVLGFERLMDRSVRWHEDESTGNKAQRLTSGSNALHDFLRLLHNDMLATLVSFVGIIASFLWFNPLFGLTGLAFLAAFLGVQWFFYLRIRGMIAESKQAAENATGVYVEGASNILTIKALNIEQNIATNVAAREVDARRIKLRINWLMFWKWRCLQIVSGLATGGFVLLVAFDVLRGGTSPGELVVLFTYFRSLHEAAGDSTGFFDSISDLWITMGRMAPIFEADASSQPGHSPFPKDWGRIELRGLSSRYTGDRGGVRDFDLAIAKGEHVGVVGSSGAGKSSIAKVLLGVHPVQSGSYTIGGVPFAKIARAEVSRHMSMVLQDSELFNMSFGDNITLMRDVPSERLIQAVCIARLEPVLAKLSDGMESLIGEKGYRLSGGERQRLGIARAICKNPDILILDEATSALDAAVEEEIHSSLLEELGDKTLIIIAHRLSTLKKVDRVVVIEDGTVVEEGEPQALIRDGGKFARMWQDQLGGKLG